MVCSSVNRTHPVQMEKHYKIIATKKQQSIFNYRFIVVSSRVLSIAVLSGAITK